MNRKLLISLKILPEKNLISNLSYSVCSITAISAKCNAKKNYLFSLFNFFTRYFKLMLSNISNILFTYTQIQI